MRKELIIILFLVLLLSGCKTTKYIEVPVDKVKIEYRDRLKHDNIYIHDKDSIFIEHKGDTVFLNKYKLKYIYRNVYLRDTIANTDTITKIQKVDVVKEVNVLKWYQKLLMALGIACLGIIIYYIIKLIRKL